MGYQQGGGGGYGGATGDAQGSLLGVQERVRSPV